MDLSIREHIINNFKGDDYDTLRRAIDESVASQDEVTLPGLGVFLEIIWENADQELKNQIVDMIKKPFNDTDIKRVVEKTIYFKEMN